MVQHWAVFNLTNGKGFTPRSVGAHSNLTELVSERTVPCALIYLLADARDWKDARIVVAGDAMKKGDLPVAKEHSGIKDVDLMKALQDTPDKRMVPVSWLIRSILREKNLASYPKVFKEVHDELNNVFYKKTIIVQGWFENPVAPPHDRADVVLVNLDRGEHLDPRFFGGDGSLFDTAFNGWNAGAGSALMLMLAAGNRAGDGDLPTKSPTVGAWAGDRIAVLDRAELPSGSVDVSRVAQEALEGAGIVKVAVAAPKKTVRRKSTVVLPKQKELAPL